MTAEAKRTSGSHSVKRYKAVSFEDDYQNILKNRVTRSGDCLLYKGVSSRGRPRAFRHGKNVHLTRYIYSHAKKVELTKLQVLMHSCDNPMCLNLDHLSVGTQKDNVDDMCKKRRHWAHKKNV